ncbi:GEVED domain-containing protein, partial [Photobacterium aquimaris]|uniref:GEVED domain-containing protein n=1 Tax=Photobacterium aquimaris TaxID=512643 RepID=UPI001356639C
MKQTSDSKRITVVDAHLFEQPYFKENAISILKIKNISQIIAKIESEKEIQILDIFAHGEAGKIIIGQDEITLNNIDQYKNTLTILGRHLANNAHINLLGCDIAQTDAGKLLVDKFAQYTGVSVAASNDKTGASELGGDWELEYQTSNNVISALNTEVYSFNEYSNYPQVLACSTSMKATTGADIQLLPGYNDDPADGFPAGKMTVVGDELWSSGLKVGGGLEKRFEIEVLAPGAAADATFPMKLKYKFRIRCANSGDCDALFGLTDHIDVNVGGFGDNPFVWAAMDGDWNGTNIRILGASDWSGYSSTVTGLSTTPRDFTLEYTIQSDGSMTSVMSAYEIDGTELHVTPEQTEPNTLDLSQGLYFAHFTHANDPSSQNYVFMGFESIAAMNHCDFGDHNVRYLAAAHDASADTTLYIGTTITDIEESTQNAANGGVDVSGDDGDANGDDEDGIFVGPIANNIAIQGQVFNVGDTVTLNLPTNGTGVVNAWVDWNDDGDFNDVDEKIATDLSPVANVVSIPLEISLNSTIGTINARFRYGSETNLNWHGEAVDGEVEDHSFIVNGDLDYGDAPDTGVGTGPDNFQTLASDGGAYQTINSDLYIGNSAPDLDVGDLQDATATADNLDNQPDESDLNLPPIQVSSSDYKIYLPITNHIGATATLAGWIDFNRNGQFEESEGQLVQIPSGVTQVNTELEWNNINPSSSTHLFMRLRLISSVVTDISNVSAIGGYGSGEVEDHRIEMKDIDLGDAPDSYGIDPTLGGAYHVITNTSNLYLGNSTIDTDTSAQASSDALGDDNSGSDDENGLAAALMPIPLGSTSYSIELTVRNTTGNDAYLAGWIDSNRNGSFDAIEGQVVTIATGQNGTFTYTLNHDQLRYLTAGNSFIRFRLSTDPLTITDMNGMASDGEVEDHSVLLGGGDFGDLPDTSSSTAANNYQTDLANNGPYHSV